MLSNTIDIANTSYKRDCIRQGFFPVPLELVPSDSLKGLEVYIYINSSYNLYNTSGHPFVTKDLRRLIDAGIQYAYISSKDYQRYYDAVENSLDSLFESKKIALRAKCEIVYATTLALAQGIYSSEPNEESVRNIKKLTKKTIKLILKKANAFKNIPDIINHDFLTSTHVSSTSIIMLCFANSIGITDEDVLAEIGTGVLLHDIGKMFIPKDLLTSKNSLSQKQLCIIRNHVSDGVDYLKKYAFLSKEILRMISEHHERLDGSGYPNKLRNGGISIYGKMLAIVDAFEAMTSFRPYREICFSTQQALDYIDDKKSIFFDNKIAEAFIDFMQNNLTDVKEEKKLSVNDHLVEVLGFNTQELNPSGRRHERFYFRIKSSLKKIQKEGIGWHTGDGSVVIVYNFSQSGLGLLTDEGIDKGQIVQVDISVEHYDLHLTYLGKVVRCLNHADGWYTVGIELFEQQTVGQVQRVYNALR